MDWKRKLAGLKSLIAEVGPLWSGTRLSGYAEQGPYSCGNCRFLVGFDRCIHSAVKADPQTTKGFDGLPVVNAARGCCEFVEPRK